MDEIRKSKEIGPRIRHGLSRLLGRTGLNYENKKMYDIYTHLYPDPLKGDAGPGNYERRLAELEDRTSRSLGRKALVGVLGWAKEWWTLENSPSFSTGETELILDEGEFMEMLSDPNCVETRQELEQISASPDPIAELRQRFNHLGAN